MKDLRTMDIFASKNDLRIIRITNDDTMMNNQKIDLFRELVLKHQDLYPNIDEWLERKVIPGLITKQRIAYLGLNNNIPVAASILKKGERAKFCHLHIESDYRNINLGEIFFILMALDIQRQAQSVFFTLPESLWETKKDFFNSFGFTNVLKANKQYRLFNEELYCAASFKEVWQKSLNKLPKIINLLLETEDNIFNGILISIKPNYTDKIINKVKTVEIRRKFSKKWIGHRVTLYSTAPEQALCGYATIDNVDEGAPDDIWNKFGDYIGGTQEEYKNYTFGCEKVYAITLREIEKYVDKVPIYWIAHLLDKELDPPQSYLSIENNPLWAQAISIAELLHNRFNFETQLYR